MKYKLIATFSLLFLPAVAIAGGPNQEPRGAMEEEVQEFGQESYGTFEKEYRGNVDESLQEGRAAMVEDFPAVEQMTDGQIASKLQLLNNLEIRLGNMAVQKSPSNSVKNFARRLIQDHETANSRLEEVASASNIEIEDLELSAQRKQIVRRVQELSGEEFDRTFLKEMDLSHARTAEFLRTAEKTSRSPELKEYLASLIPTIEEHRSTVRTLQKDLGNL